MPHVEYDRAKIEERKLEIRRILSILGTPGPSLTRSGDVDDPADVNLPTTAMTSESGKSCLRPDRSCIEGPLLPGPSSPASTLQP